MGFWDNVFDNGKQAPQPGPTLGVPKAWWQDERAEQVYQQPHELALGYQPNPSGYGQQEHDGLTVAEIKAIRKRGHDKINAEQAEQIAEYDLATKTKYQHRCPECDSGNFIPAGTRVNVGGVGIMPTDKCFDCGYSARGPERAIGASSSGASIHTRQIDTGGAGGQSMFGQFNGVPRSYMPKA